MSTPTSYETKTGDGVTALFSFDFPYLQEIDIEVLVDDVEQGNPADFSLPNANQILFVVPPALNAVIVIRRDSLKNGRAIDYSNGSLTEEELDTDSLQAFYALEEARDKSALEAEAAAASAAAQAIAARDKAESWADEAEDVEVEPGRFSANHHATKAAASAAAAAVFTPSALWPIGSLYFNADNDANPAALLGFGTWAAFAQGVMILGSGTHTDTRAEERTFSRGNSGGAFQHQLTPEQMASHFHSITAVRRFGSDGPSSTGWSASNGASSNGTRNSDSKGSDEPHNNMPPYITVNIWRRTA